MYPMLAVLLSAVPESEIISDQTNEKIVWNVFISVEASLIYQQEFVT